MFFKRLHRVEFRDTDAAGIAHFSVFFNWMEQTEHAFLRHLNWSVVMESEGAKISWPRVATKCDFVRPVSFENVFGIQLQLVRLGRSSATYQFRFLAPSNVMAMGMAANGLNQIGWSEGTDWFSETVRPFAVGTIAAVCCRIKPGSAHQSIEIPAELRASLLPYLCAESEHGTGA